jgi:hypothetical protein
VCLTRSLPSTPPPFLQRHPPSEAQVAAAEVLLAELQLTEFDCRAVLNPALQRHYEVGRVLPAAGAWGGVGCTLAAYAPSAH